MDDAFEHAVRLVEAFIFASAEPVAARALWRLIPMPYSASDDRTQCRTSFTASVDPFTPLRLQ